MIDFLAHVFDTSGFPPRWQCGDWSEVHGWLHILSDLAIWSAYFAIPVILISFVVRRRDIPFRGIFWLFGAFILACGTTHLMEAIIFWHPLYRLAGVVKLFTAIVSWATVVALVPSIPKVLAMRSPEELQREVAARKQAEEDLRSANAELANQVALLRASEERFRLLVDSTKDYAIFMLDPTGRIASWNPGAQRIKQYRADEIIGQHFSRFYPPDVVERGWPDEELRRATAEGRFEDEGWRLRKDGSRFWANVVITALRDGSGSLRGFSKITRDMTERRQAEENARRLLEEQAARRVAEEYVQVVARQREELRVTLTSIGDGVVTTDAQGRVTFLNPVAETLTGWTTADAAGQPLTAVFPIINEKTRKAVENPVAKVLDTGHVVGLANHTILIARDGTERPIDDSAAPIKRPDGQISGVVLVFRDVTEQRRAERTARFLASIVESSDDAIIGKDVNGVITSWNRAAERLFGYSAAEAIGQPVVMLAPPDRVDEMPAILERVRREERVDQFDTLRRTKDGRLVPVSLSVSPVKDEEGHIVGASKIARDVSERQRAEAALREEKARLHATLTGIGDAVIVTDAEGCITLMNPVAQTLTGWKDEAVGRPLEEVFRILNEQTGQATESPVRRVLREGAIVGLANHTVLVAKDDTAIPIDDSAAPVRDAQGRIVGVVLVFRDVSDKRRVEQQVAALNRDLRRRVTEFQSLLDVLPVGIAVADDPECRHIWMNPALSRLMKLPPQANISLSAPAAERPGFQIFDGDRELAPDELPMQVAIATGRPVYGVKHSLVLVDGTRLNLLQYAVPLRDEEGKVRGGLYVGVDITEQERTQQALRQAEARWRTMAEALPNLVWTDLPDGQCDWLSSQWGKYTGIPESELLGLRWLERVIHPDDRQRTLDCWRAACADQGDYDVEYRIRRYDGEYHWFKTRGVPIRDEQGRITYWFGTCTDIEDHKRAERQLADAHQFLNSSLDALSSHIAVLDENGIILAVNAAWRRFADGNRFTGRNYGIGADYLQAWEANSAECMEAEMVAGLKDVLAGRAPSFEFEYPCHSPTEQRWFVMRATRFQAPGPLRVVVAHEDVTKRMRAEEALKEADRRKDNFLATLAHELRNPLAPIRNAVELMQRSSGDPAAIQQARGILGRQVGQMVRLVDDLLDISRITSGKLQLRGERVQLADVVQNAVETSRPFIDAQAHELTLTLPQEPIYLDADPTRLSQVLSNLLNNAAKYTERGGHIWLTVECQGSQAVVSVRDTGIGIPADHLRHIFTMFSQVAPALDRSQGGLGVGLALVRGLVELHGGAVEAHSSPGEGSEFIVRLPRIEAPADAPTETVRECKSATSETTLRVLVVDDNRDGAESLALMLRMVGHDTRTAHDGVEAVQAAAAFRPDVVLLDIGMPRMNGYEAARHIREQPWGKRMVLVALTGWGQEEDKRRATEAGFHYHLTKPVEPGALEKLLEGLTQRSDGD
ncbi:MAG: PAS domain S-box protein [Gemmataceae bacterium]|nr:PAS domain S-box protein [Gemmataceae bacterium]